MMNTVQETAEATGVLIGNIIADKITSVRTSKEKKKQRKLKKFIFRQKKEQIIDNLKLFCSELILHKIRL